MKKRRVLFLAGLVISLLVLAGCGFDLESVEPAEEPSEESTEESVSGPAEEINLYDVDGGGTNYAFTCDGEEFRAQHTWENWRIFDSYKITNEKKMTVICQALIDTYPVHGKDMESYRTADDMVYEWQQHNLAYTYLPEDNPWRESAMNVDFDPEDQGRSFEEIYEDRTGREFDLEEKIKEELEEGHLMEKLEEYLTGD